MIRKIVAFCLFFNISFGSNYFDNLKESFINMSDVEASEFICKNYPYVVMASGRSYLKGSICYVDYSLFDDKKLAEAENILNYKFCNYDELKAFLHSKGSLEVKFYGSNKNLLKTIRYNKVSRIPCSLIKF